MGGMGKRVILPNMASRVLHSYVFFNRRAYDAPGPAKTIHSVSPTGSKSVGQTGTPAISVGGEDRKKGGGKAEILTVASRTSR